MLEPRQEHRKEIVAMTVKNSGCHLVVEVSAEVIGQFLHRFYTSHSQIGVACKLWPLPSRVFELEERVDGGAVIAADCDQCFDRIA